MPQIQCPAQTIVQLILLYHAGFEGDAAGNDVCQARLKRVGVKQGEQLFVTQYAGFDGFRRTIGKNVGGEGTQAVRVAQHGGRLKKDARQVFARLQVNGGFSADGGIHVRQQCGGHLDIADAP